MKVDDIRKLHQRRYREELGHFLVEGEHLVLELQKAAATNPALRRAELYVTHEYEHWRSPFPQHLISAGHFARLADTKNPQGIFAVVPIPPTPAPSAEERNVYLHEVQDPGNLGTILRTLAWFGAVVSNSRARTLGAIGCECLESVVWRNRRFLPAWMPFSRIRRSIRLRPTRRPLACRSSWIRGLP